MMAPQTLPYRPKNVAQADVVATAKVETRQLAFELATSPDTKVHLHLTNHAHALMMFINTSSALTPAASACSLRSLVFAMPNLSDTASPPLSTPLYSHTASVDCMTRLAKILAKRLGKPVYVGGDVTFWSQDDEMAALKAAVEVVLQDLS